MHGNDGDIRLDDQPRPLSPPGVAPPGRLRLLCLSPVEPAWVPLTVALHGAGWTEPHFRWVSGQAEALRLLRDQGFDCLWLAAGEGRAAPTVAALLEFLRALRAGGHDEGALLVSSGLSDAEWAQLLELDCEVLVTSRYWECPAVVPAICRAARLAHLARENSQLCNAQRRRLVRERDEATQLISQQWRMLEELQTLSTDVSQAADDPSRIASSPAESDEPRGVRSESDTRSSTPATGSLSLSLSRRLPSDVGPYYHELLRIYVIMGSGSLGAEIARLADRLAIAGLTPREVLELHLERVETLVRRLGSRSARHVLARADLLALEVMMHLGECYQRRAGGGIPAELPSDALASPVQHPERPEAA
jgi:hypothetical protein